MIPILTSGESAELDRRSRDRGVTVDRLMENAGRAVARVVSEVLGGTYGRRAAVVCGKGNNGGDALVAGRYLERWGARVTAVLVTDPAAFRDDAATNLRRFEGAGGRVRPFEPSTARREIHRADVVIDGIFGTGFRGSPEGVHRRAIEAINDADVPVVAVDIPSGVEGDSGSVRDVAVMADATVTFGAPKPGVVFFPGAAHAGIPHVVDIGFPADLVTSQLWLLERADVARLLPRRQDETHKRSAGVVLVLAGSRAMTGAAALVAQAAYRAGAGLVTVAVPRSVLPIVEGLITEATFVPLDETEEGTVADSAWSVLRGRLDDVDAVALGPGLTTHPSTIDLVRRTVAEAPAPLIVDADALNAFAGHGGHLARRRATAVITPHAGEFARLTGVPAADVAADRVALARKAATEFDCVVVLKGSRTVVADPDGRAVVSPTGGPFLATAGTGDVLTGTIGAFLAGGMGPADAAAAGAFVHGLAGRIAAREIGPGVIASDVMARLPAAATEIVQER
ncbi:MAG: NAD(P)H-hydrate dehydratase [Actinomycetota bacterium]